jgi:hypothetical protein
MRSGKGITGIYLELKPAEVVFKLQVAGCPKGSEKIGQMGWPKLFYLELCTF